MQLGRPQDRKRAAPRDKGISLVEVVVSIALTGGIVVAIFGALFSVVRSADQNDDASLVQAVIGGASDNLAGAGWEACPEVSGTYLAEARSAALRVGWELTAVTFDDIDYWSVGAGGWVEDCDGAASLGAAATLQRITVRVTAPDGATAKTFDVVKSLTTPYSLGDPNG